ncbi:MAG: putative rane protein [Chthonomonadaceae bacterium]|nr:putative rane protein [Chthonomonadaceae bacterium]
MNIVFWIVVGIIAGFLAKVVVPGEGPGGILGDLIVGVLGALIGGFVAGMLGIAFGGWVGTTLMAFLGAVILLFVLRAITSRRNVA